MHPDAIELLLDHLEDLKLDLDDLGLHSSAELIGDAIAVIEDHVLSDLA